MTISARSYALAVGLLLSTSAASGAQAPRALIGLVRDSAGHRIPSAEVRARGNIVVARTDDSGRFQVAQMPVGARGVFVRRLGFAPARVMITPRPGDTDSVDVVLTAVATALPSVVAMAQHDSMSHKLLAEFWERRSKGFGRFITRDDIVQRGAIHFVDLIRTVPGAMIQTAAGRQEIRFSRSVIRDCPPQYWVDGIPIEHGSAEEFTPDNVEAIEMYSGPSSTPPQFVTRAMTCGTIVIWSRLPG